MRQMISGLVAAIAVVVVGAAPAKACDGGCSPCAYVNPCGAAYERLPDPEVQYHSRIATPQYYYVEQGPTYTGPGDFAPRRVYREEGISRWGYRHYHASRHYPWRHHHWHHYGYHYGPHVLHSYY
jgi:hypothetical protein